MVTAPLRTLTTTDLWMYISHVLVTIGSPNDLIYFLPRLLELWAEHQPFSSGLGEQLFKRQIVEFFNNEMPDQLKQASLEFIDQVFLNILNGINRFQSEKSDNDRRREYVWPEIWYVRAQLGAIAQLWDKWWFPNAPGFARAAVQYGSALLCEENDNPAFVPWTPDLGGGPPSLHDGTGLSQKSEWLPDNVSEFKVRVTVVNLISLLNRCKVVLTDTGERKIIDEILLRPEIIPEVAEQNITKLLKSISGEDRALYDSK